MELTLTKPGPRSRPALPTSSRSATVTGKKLRRSQRVALRVPLITYSDQARMQPHAGYQGDALAVRVSAYGGLLEYSGPWQTGDRFMLKHVNRSETTECRVVYTKEGKLGKRIAGFEFTAGRVNFWGMSFPSPGRS